MIYVKFTLFVASMKQKLRNIVLMPQRAADGYRSIDLGGFGAPQSWRQYEVKTPFSCFFLLFKRNKPRVHRILQGSRGKSGQGKPQKIMGPSELYYRVKDSLDSTKLASDQKSRETEGAG